MEEKNLEVDVGYFCAVQAIIELVSGFQVTMSCVGTHLYSIEKMNCGHGRLFDNLI